MVASVMKYFYLVLAVFCLVTGVTAGFMHQLPLSVLVGSLSLLNFGLYFIFHREVLKQQQR
ncbi:hypothetical protein [Bacillus kexueae]|uniref:hypothetical protein n=1 Tax=Aeribacillus kexueae TaxID=2078952 RepID=UPI001FAECB90|nr:hypothetical protein [Bacillus kexueae]